MDPCPISSTTGPKLRAWLDSKLVLTLEQRFFCVRPSQLIPVWLAEAGLTLLPTSSVLLNAVCPDKGEILGELSTEVGRQVWMELWGGFIKTEQWWWEDLDIVEECERLGTVWEYLTINAIKA
jgi:hypothetical protein